MPTTLKTQAAAGITSVKAFTPGTDTLAANGTADTVTYGVANPAFLTVVWNSLADGVYDCVYFAGSIAVASDVITVAGATTTAHTPPTLSEIWTTALTEAYRATGATGTAAQLLYEILQNLTNFTNVAGVRTIKRLNGTSAKTYTYDSAATPASLTETS